MKKLLAGMIIIGVVSVVVAQPLVVKYWQDAIPRPNERWVKMFGNSDWDQVAYCIDGLLRTNRTRANEIIKLTNELKQVREHIEQLQEQLDGKEKKESEEAQSYDGSGPSGQDEDGSGTDDEP